MHAFCRHTKMSLFRVEYPAVGKAVMYMPHFFKMSTFFFREFTNLVIYNVTRWLRDCREEDAKERSASSVHSEWFDLGDMPDRDLTFNIRRSVGAIEVTTCTDDVEVSKVVIRNVVRIADALMMRTRAVSIDVESDTGVNGQARAYEFVVAKAKNVLHTANVHFYTVCKQHVLISWQPVMFTVDTKLKQTDEHVIKNLESVTNTLHKCSNKL